MAAAGEPQAHVLEDLKQLFGRRVKVVQAQEDQLRQAIGRARAAPW